MKKCKTFFCLYDSIVDFFFVCNRILKNIFGHRGLPQIYYENTFEGINKAFEYCDFVETDVRLTKDNNLVLFHDSNIAGSLIKNMTLKEIDEALRPLWIHVRVSIVFIH